MATTTDERFDLGLEAIEHFSKALKAMDEAGLYFGGIQRAAMDLATIMSNSLYILDPVRAKKIAEENINTRQAAQTKDAPGFVGEDRPGTGMYEGYL